MTAGYAIIPRTLQIQPWWRALSDKAARLGLYLAAGPHSNIVGAFEVPDGYIAADLDWTTETVQQTISELFEAGFLKRFGGGRYVVLLHHGAWNSIKNPNVMKAALKQLDTLPADLALSVVFQWLAVEAKRLGKGLPNSLETIRQSMGIPLPNTEAEAEAEIEAKTEIEIPGLEEGKRVAATPVVPRPGSGLRMDLSALSKEHAAAVADFRSRIGDGDWVRYFCTVAFDGATLVIPSVQLHRLPERCTKTLAHCGLKAVAAPRLQ